MSPRDSDPRPRAPWLRTFRPFDMRTALAILVAILAAGSARESFGAPAADPAVGAILDRARLWVSRDRLDLARQALDKLFAIVSNHPDALSILAEIQVRSADPAAAQKTLDRLREMQPRHPGVARLQTLLRLNGADKNKLRAARLLAKSGQTQAAVAALRSLYPGGPPNGELALEYWQLVAATPTGWEAARDGLTRLVQDHPDNLRYRLALAELQAARQPLSPEGLQFVIALTRMPAYAKQAQAVWRRAVMRLNPAAPSMPLLREYLAHDPGDFGVKERLAESVAAVDEARRAQREAASRRRKALDQERRLLADPAYRAKLEGLARLDRGDLAGAQEQLEQALARRADDGDVVGGIGLLRLRQGRHGEAQAYFERALQLDSGNRAKWTSLVRTARFWGTLREADAAREAGAFELAERKVHEALALDPREPDALIALARLHAEQGRAQEAQKTYRAALALEPNSRSALRGLISMHVSRGARDVVETLIAGLSPDQREALSDYLPALRAGLLRDDAGRLAAAGRLSEAAATLERAAKIDVTHAWVRYDLARLYARRGDAGRGQGLFDELLRARPGDADALHALALFQSGEDDDSSALATLERVSESERSESITRLQRRLWTRVQMRRAETLAKAGLTSAAEKVLRQTESGVAGDVDLATSVAFAWAELGELRHARELMDRLLVQQASPPPAWRLRHAELLAQCGADAELDRLLDAIAASGELTADDKQTLVGLRESLALRTAERLRNEGRSQAALRTLRSVLQSNPDHVRALYSEARILRASHRPKAAQASYRHLLSLNPNDDEAYLALIETLIETRESAEAARLIRQRLWLLTGSRTGEVDTQVELASALIDLERYDLARRQLEIVVAVAPDQSRALALLADLARRDGRLTVAARYLQRSLAAQMTGRTKLGPLPRLSRLVQAPPSQASAAAPQWSADLLARLSIDPAPPDALAEERPGAGTYRTLAELLDEGTAWLSTGVDGRARSGNDGTSRLRAVEAPVELKLPWRARGRVFFRTDLAALDAGTLNVDDPERAPLFGTLLLCQPTCGGGSTSVSATGLSLTLGYERQNVWVDVGTTPLGFPVQSLVGGVLYKGDLGAFSYSIDASRRPITSTALSYAGTDDPRTGAVWGGVTASGLRLGLSHDQGGSFGAWSSLGFHRLTGRNVQDNDRVQLMAGGYWRIVNEEDRLVSVGMTGMLWRFEENAGEFTFGHGGYYSPQSYRSLSLSAAFGERTARFSYLLRGSVSVSHSRFDTAPFYPTDASLQAQAVALSSITGVDPHYDGSDDSGDGYSLTAAFEYQLSPRAFIGTRLGLERSPYYAPNRALVYVRYAVDQVAARPVSLPPNPVMPTSEL